jgi:hypothetical protein
MTKSVRIAWAASLDVSCIAPEVPAAMAARLRFQQVGGMFGDFEAKNGALFGERGNEACFWEAIQSPGNHAAGAWHSLVGHF